MSLFDVSALSPYVLGFVMRRRPVQSVLVLEDRLLKVIIWVFRNEIWPRNRIHTWFLFILQLCFNLGLWERLFLSCEETDWTDYVIWRRIAELSQRRASSALLCFHHKQHQTSILALLQKWSPSIITHLKRNHATSHEPYARVLTKVIHSGLLLSIRKYYEPSTALANNCWHQ